MNPHLYLNWVLKDEYVSHKCSHVQQELHKFDKHVKGHGREGKMGLVTIIPSAEMISFIIWTSVPLGAHRKGATDHHVRNG